MPFLICSISSGVVLFFQKIKYFVKLFLEMLRIRLFTFPFFLIRSSPEVLPLGFISFAKIFLSLSSSPSLGGIISPRCLLDFDSFWTIFSIKVLVPVTEIDSRTGNSIIFFNPSPFPSSSFSSKSALLLSLTK